MKYLSLALLFMIFNAWSQDKYFGAKSTEALLHFDAFIEVKTESSLSLERLNGTTPRALEMKQKRDHQIEFLIGHFQSESFLATFKYPGVLGDKYQARWTSVEARKDSLQRLRYRFEGKVVFHTSAFHKSDVITLPLRLPVNPDTFYELGIVNGKNKCTDEHYDSEEDLFYFWDPDKKGCPLKANTTDVLRFEGRLKKMANTLSTYPEYDRLYKNEELKISVFLGYIGDRPRESRTQDEGYLTFLELSQEMTRNGFEVASQKNFKTINYLTTFEKTLRNQLGIIQKVTVSILLSDSSVGVKDPTFSSYFSSALKNSHIVSYDGHSGLGGNLDIERFEVDKLPSFYQIFFFNGCSSYPYFNSMYFTKKPAGKKNLEILTAGLPTLTSTSTANMLAFLQPFLGGRIHSYQTIMRDLERSNGEESTYLMGVNGDEDNLFKPEGRGISPLAVIF